MPLWVPAHHWLTVNEVARLLEVSARTVWRNLADERFPRPIKFTVRRVRWRRCDLESYIATLREDGR